MSVGSDISSPRKVDLYLLVIVIFAASLVLGDYVIRFYVYVLQVSVPHQIIAGFTEPVTTKLVPAIAIVWIHQWKNIPLTSLQSHPYWFAFLGGISLGVFERILYLVVKGASISPGFILVPLIHALNAVLIAGLVFSSVDRLSGYRFLGKILAATVTAMAVHVFWNTWGVVLV